MKNQENLPVVCTDLCEHCIYIGEGDFICENTKYLCIEDFNPKICKYPNKKKEED
jgi:hypothetical protein